MSGLGGQCCGCQQDGISTTSQSHSHNHHALPAHPQSFFARSAEQVAPELIGCLLVKHKMVSVMATGSEVFGSSVEEIDVSVGSGE